MNKRLWLSFNRFWLSIGINWSSLCFSVLQHFNVVAETYKAEPIQKRWLLSGSGFQLQPN